jgi:hypothetical protein
MAVILPAGARDKKRAIRDYALNFSKIRVQKEGISEVLNYVHT